MPDVSDRARRGERERLAPVRPRVRGDARGLVPGDPWLASSAAAAVQACAVTPAVVEFDPVRGIGRDQRRLGACEQRRDVLLVGCVPAHQPMRSELVDLAKLRAGLPHRNGGQLIRSWSRCRSRRRSASVSGLEKPVRSRSPPRATSSANSSAARSSSSAPNVRLSRNIQSPPAPHPARRTRSRSSASRARARPRRAYSPQ